MKISARIYPIAYWPYERAYPTDIFLEFERTEEWNQTEREWSNHFGVSVPDNKVVYKIQGDENQQKDIYIQFKDGYVRMGFGVRPYHGSELSLPYPPRQ